MSKEKSFTLVTVCTHMPQESYFCLNEYFKSTNNEPVLLLDTGFHSYTGLGSKPKMLYKAIKEKAINTYYTLFTDCFDFVFSKNPSNLMCQFFNRFGAPLVISSEKNCFPDTLRNEYDALNPPTSYAYLNSGMIAGETEALLACLEAMDLKNVPEDYRMENGQNFHVNDQELWQQLFLKQPVNIALDYQQILCNTLHSVKLEDLDFNGEQIKNIETGEYPASFHLNGSAKTDGLRNPILQKLGL